MTTELTYSLYRKSTIGVCLTETLAELMGEEIFNEDTALNILFLFDKSINAKLPDLVKTKTSFTGRLHTYRNCDSVWTLIMENVTFRFDQNQNNYKPPLLTTDKIKIIACEAKTKK